MTMRRSNGVVCSVPVKATQPMFMDRMDEFACEVNLRMSDGPFMSAHLNKQAAIVCASKLGKGSHICAVSSVRFNLIRSSLHGSVARISQYSCCSFSDSFGCKQQLAERLTVSGGNTDGKLPMYPVPSNEQRGVDASEVDDNGAMVCFRVELPSSDASGSNQFASSKEANWALDGDGIRRLAAPTQLITNHAARTATHKEMSAAWWADSEKAADSLTREEKIDATVARR
ncbi:hypothetical protein QBC34DRAFT_68000 [Podospora aff. communis PSN243]|uniref:Uncharacterized protein n=1 Tax=Podospora aff. communis PSN243 TaxID=3040156 RepID=A0AAV9H324_9PEZI|nr:hypothetical protein QBC34DRAFT_68000 [Podospora aff. communis PSN243]